MNTEDNTCVKENLGCPKSKDFANCICDQRFAFCSSCEKGYYYVKSQSRCIKEEANCDAYYEDDVSAADQKDTTSDEEEEGKAGKRFLETTKPMEDDGCAF